jgi:hypothetical protein
MFKNPLQNIEAIENVVIVLLGVILLFTLEPVSTLQIILANVLAALLVIILSDDVWHWWHRHS